MLTFESGKRLFSLALFSLLSDYFAHDHDAIVLLRLLAAHLDGLVRIILQLLVAWQDRFS